MRYINLGRIYIEKKYNMKLIKIFFISLFLFFFSVNVFSHSESTIDLNVKDLIYNPVTHAIEFDLQMKQGANYGTQGNLYIANIRFNIYLEGGVELVAPWPSAAVSYNASLGITGVPIQATVPGTPNPGPPPGYSAKSVSMAVNRESNGMGNLTASYITVARLSLPLTVASAIPTNATYLVLRGAPVYAMNGMSSYWSAHGGAIQQAFNPSKAQFHLICPEEATWTGAVSTDWNNPLNWNAKELATDVAYFSGILPSTCTYVTIPAGLTNYPVLATLADTTAVCDIIHFKHGGQVIGTNFLNYNDAKVEMTLENTRWYAISAPLRDMYCGDYLLSESTGRRNPSTSIMRYQADNPQYTSVTKQNGKWSNTFITLNVRLDATTSTAFALKINKGTAVDKPYTFTIPSTATTYEYYNQDGTASGIFTNPMTRTNSGRFIYEEAVGYNPVTGAFSSPIENGTTTAYGTVIIGNPFMAPLDVTKFYLANAANLSGSFHVWENPVPGVEGTPETYHLFGGKIVSTKDNVTELVVAPMQAFFAQRAGTASFSTLSFTPDMAVMTAPTPQLRANASDSFEGRLNITVSRDGRRESGAVILYQSGADNGYVEREDAKALFISNLDNVPAVIYSAVDDNALAINTVGDLSEEIALGISTSVTGLLTLDFKGMESFGTATIELVDYENNTTQDLTINPSFTFDNTVGDVEGRFALRIASQTPIIDIEEGGLEDLIVYADNGIVHIDSSEPILNVKITSIPGQCLYQETTAGVYNVRVPLHLNSQTVLVQVQTEKSSTIEKVFVK